MQDNMALAEGELIAQFGSDVTCTAGSGMILLVGLTSVIQQVSVRVPRCAYPLDQVMLVAKVYDQAGNLGYSPADTSLRVAAPPGFDITDGNADYTSTIAAYGDRIDNQDNPIDLAVDPVTGVLFVTLQNNDEIIVVFPDRVQDRLSDINNNRYRPNQPEGIALSTGGYLFIGAVGDQRIEIIPPWLPPNRDILDNLGGANGRPHRLTIDESAALPTLCGGEVEFNSVSCYLAPVTSAYPMVSELAIDIGKTAQAADLSVDPGDNTLVTLWILASDCSVYSSGLIYDVGLNSIGTGALTPVGLDTGLSGNCDDLVVLPSGDFAIADQGDDRLLRVTPAGVVSVIASGFQSLTGLDFAGNFLYALDGNAQVVYKIEALTTPF